MVDPAYPHFAVIDEEMIKKLNIASENENTRESTNIWFPVFYEVGSTKKN